MDMIVIKQIALSTMILSIYSSVLPKETERFVTENDTVVLQCNIPNGNNMSSWTCCNGMTLVSGSEVNPENNITNTFSIINKERGEVSLRIRHFGIANEGLYQCTTNGHSGILHTKYNVRLLRPPTNITIKEEKNGFVFCFAGNNVNITCSVMSGIPKEIITWSSDMELIKTGGPKNLTINVNPSKKYHMKHFKCGAKNMVSEIERSVQLYVFSPPSVQLKPDFVNVTEADSLALTCNFNSNHKNNTLEWYRLGGRGRWDLISDTLGKLLHFERISRNDSGKYRCLVENPAGHDESNATVNVQYSPDITINLTDNKRTLLCNPNGNPANYTFFQWEHRSEYNDFIRFISGDQSGRLELPNITDETTRHHDRGKYICYVSNGIVRDGKHKQSQNFILDEEGLPYFVSSNNAWQFSGKGKKDFISVYFVSHPNDTDVEIFNMSFEKLQNLTYSRVSLKVVDKIYGRNVRVDGYHLDISIPVAHKTRNQVRWYTIGVNNSYGTVNYTVYISPASSTSRNVTQYILIGLLIVMGLVIVILFAYFRNFGGHRPKLKLSLRCLKCISSRNAALDDIGGVQNDGYGVQNAIAASSNQDEIPVYSSIDRKKTISIASAVSYSVNKRQKPDPRHHCKKVTHENDKVSKNMNPNGQFSKNTNKKQEKQELNYIEISFDPKPKEDKFEIHGLDQRSTYIDIDFSKKVNQLPESDSDDNSDDDFASVDDLRRMRKSRLPEH